MPLPETLLSVNRPTTPPAEYFRAFDAPRPSLWFYASELPEAVRLDASNPKWIQLCTAGSYVYQGRPVAVSTQTFDDMVRNFRAHAAYNAQARSIVGKPDAEVIAFGVALTSGVIALNFDHPPKGGPRPGHGWFLDVERRSNELWGLCWFDAEAHAGMLSGKWKWTSIEWQGDWSDNKGTPIGAYLSGVALTNDPFITGMRPIQMSAPEARGVVWFEAHDLPATTEPANIPSHPEKEPAMPNDTPTPAKPSELHRRFAARLSALGTLFFSSPAAVSADDETRLVIEFERHFDRAAEVMQQMTSLQQAVGAKSPEDMMAKMKELSTLAAQSQELQAKIDALLPEVEAAHVAEEMAEGEMAAQDVAAVMSRLAGLGWGEAALESHRRVLMLQRLGGDPQTFGRHRRDARGEVVRDAKGQPVIATPAERQQFRRTAAETFRKEHQIRPADQAPTQAQYSFANIFAGPNAQHPAGEQRQDAPPWMGFSNAGTPAAPPPPAAPNGWTWSRVASLPPAAVDNPVNRIVDEMIRTELNGAKPTQAQLSSFFARVPRILSSMGEMPPTFFSAFRSAA